MTLTAIDEKPQPLFLPILSHLPMLWFFLEALLLHERNKHLGNISPTICHKNLSSSSKAATLVYGDRELVTHSEQDMWGTLSLTKGRGGSSVLRATPTPPPSHRMYWACVAGFW